MTYPDTIANMEAAFVEALRSAVRFEKQCAVLALFNRIARRSLRSRRPTGINKEEQNKAEADNHAR